MNEWRPIETAPRDSETVILWSPELGVYTGSYCEVCEDWGAGPSTGGDFVWPNGDDPGDDSTPTHWMPLPDPPEGA